MERLDWKIAVVKFNPDYPLKGLVLSPAAGSLYMRRLQKLVQAANHLATTVLELRAKASINQSKPI